MLENRNEIKKNGWNEFSNLVVSQLKTLLEENKDLRELRYTDREFLIKNIVEVKEEVTEGLSTLESTIKLMQQASEQRADDKARRAVVRAGRVAIYISSAIAVLSGIIITVFETMIKYNLEPEIYSLDLLKEFAEISGDSVTLKKKNFFEKFKDHISS